MGTQPDKGGIFSVQITVGGVEKKERPVLRTVLEPAREIPVLKETDVLIVGGGPAGTTAAIAAARTGARVILVERYNHLGGLSTGGLVIWIDRMTDWQGNPVICGLGEELIDRLPADAIYGPERTSWGAHDADQLAFWKPRYAAFHDTVTRSPMIDPEVLKAISLSAVREAGVEIIFHAWASNAIIEDDTVAGVVFQSKSGRFAVQAKVVIDTTGDGDIFATAGEGWAGDHDTSSIHQCMNTSWLWGNVDLNTWLNFRKSEGFEGFAAEGRRRIASFDFPMPAWRNDVAVFMGPRFAGYDAVDVFDLTEVELRSRDKMAELLDYYKARAPGFEKAFVMLTAPQIGIRQSRRLVGQKSMTREDWQSGVVHPDEIGISPSLAPKFSNVSVPYGSLLPKINQGLLVAGRHLSTDASSQTFMREIPQCWMTGHAAGVAAATAVDLNVDPRLVPVNAIQAALLKQGAALRPTHASEAVA